MDIKQLTLSQRQSLVNEISSYNYDMFNKYLISSGIKYPIIWIYTFNSAEERLGLRLTTVPLGEHEKMLFELK